MTEMLANVRKRAQAWLDSPHIDLVMKDQVQALLNASDPKELIDRFYRDLEFGTGGLRGIMGPGTNSINMYTIGLATQALCNYLKKTHPHKTIQVAIAYDSRNNSQALAFDAGKVFTANGIRIHLFPELRPTPLLSFAIRHLQCDAGIVITASHNPKEYNGFKAYWNDGAQVVPPHDQLIIQEAQGIASFGEIHFGGNPALINPIGPELEDAYYKEVLRLIPNSESIRTHHALPIVYSSLHGAGITMVPECLKRIGFTNVQIVEEQREPNGDFPTIHSPNPEERSAMDMALKKGIKSKAALVMATDPDTDRVGIAIPKDNGDFMLLNGNQAFSLMMRFILKNQKDKSKTYIAKTIVTSELVDVMAKKLNIPCYNTLTGFKYIAELMGRMEGKERFIAAGEESYGYMVGDFVRDKDAVSACAFFAALAAEAAEEKKSLFEALVDMYLEYGYYLESLITLTKKGQQGEQEIRAMMEKFRTQPPASLAGIKAVRMLDYKTLKEKDLVTGEERKLDFPVSDVLQFYLEDGTKVSLRPSGTEPKIKFYISVHENLPGRHAYDTLTETLNNRLKAVENFLIDY